MIKASELKFNIPVRIPDPHFNEEKAQEDFKTTGHREYPEFVKGIMAIPIHKIESWGDTFTIFRDIQDVKERGFSSTIVCMETGEDYFCSWNKKKFEEEYDNHFEKIDKIMQEENQDDMFDPETMTPEFAEFLTVTLKEYKKLHKNNTNVTRSKSITEK